MADTEKLIEILKLAGKTHHAVYHKEDGADDDWATWYSDWLLSHTDFEQYLGRSMVRSELTAFLVKVDKTYNAQDEAMSWPEYYTEQLLVKSS